MSLYISYVVWWKDQIGGHDIFAADVEDILLPKENIYKDVDLKSKSKHCTLYHTELCNTPSSPMCETMLLYDDSDILYI